MLIDTRVGSAELYMPLTARGVACELTVLPFGDLATLGEGPQGPILVGIERKRIGDLLQSLVSGRLTGHQIPGLCDLYVHRWLLIEGSYRESAGGQLPRIGGRVD